MAFAWLKERGYALSWGAVFRHRQRFLDNLQDVQTWRRWRLQFSEAARVSGRDVLAEATLTKFEQLFTADALRDAQGRDRERLAMTTKEWGELAGAIGKVVTTRERMAEFRQSLRGAREAGVEEAKKAAKKGDSGTAVADRVREMLGIPLWDDGEDWKYGVPEYEMETFEDPLTGERQGHRRPGARPRRVRPRAPAPVEVPQAQVPRPGSSP